MTRNLKNPQFQFHLQRLPKLLQLVHLLLSRFEYVENVQSSDVNSSGSHTVSHVAPPKASGFFSEFGMDGGFPKKVSSGSSKVQIEENDEARKKFSNAKSISSAQYFGDQNRADADAQVSLQKFSRIQLQSLVPIYLVTMEIILLAILLQPSLLTAFPFRHIRIFLLSRTLQEKQGRS